jgi:hypothetical protein
MLAGRFRVLASSIRPNLRYIGWVMIGWICRIGAAEVNGLGKLFCLVAALWSLWAMPATAGPVDEVTVVTAQARHRFQVELAVTPEARAEGLMHRRSLAADAGMLFIFPESARQSFWMKNTLIPLDMLFIAGDGRIMHLHHNAQPHSLAPIGSKVDVTAVLEINGGLARRLGIHVGDLILHPSLQRRR